MTASSSSRSKGYLNRHFEAGQRLHQSGGLPGVTVPQLRKLYTLLHRPIDAEKRRRTYDLLDRGVSSRYAFQLIDDLSGRKASGHTVPIGPMDVGPELQRPAPQPAAAKPAPTTGPCKACEKPTDLPVRPDPMTGESARLCPTCYELAEAEVLAHT